ncbi:MAG: type IVB secretion system apparatus protein IcmL/DotI [Coxiellaceae bacterium]|jgi:intracellular multiplication protein IcmL|nr:type IVB secretion system apparatus protein IcmL/DotI [Coxiellaceae bacterium]
MVDDAVELVRLRNNFYRDNYRRLVGVLLVLLVIIVVLVGTILYQLVNRPEPRYFATTVDGRIMPLYPLSEPVLSPGELLQWAHRAAVAAYTYNFVNYRDAMQELQNQFTPDGWRYYEDALRVSRNLEMVIAKKLVVSAVATGTPVILDQAVINGRYSWKVQIPLLVNYQSPNEQTQRPVVVMMIISRVPTVDMPKGIAIVSFVASEGSTG